MRWFWQKKKPEAQLDLDDDKVLLMATTSLRYYTQCHQMIRDRAHEVEFSETIANGIRDVNQVMHNTFPRLFRKADRAITGRGLAFNAFSKRSFIKYLKIRGTIVDNAVRGTVKSLAEAHTDKVELESSIRGLFKVKPKLLPLCLGISSEADELVSKILSE